MCSLDGLWTGLLTVSSCFRESTFFFLQFLSQLLHRAGRGLRSDKLTVQIRVKRRSANGSRNINIDRSEWLPWWLDSALGISLLNHCLVVISAGTGHWTLNLTFNSRPSRRNVRFINSRRKERTTNSVKPVLISLRYIFLYWLPWPPTKREEFMWSQLIRLFVSVTQKVVVGIFWCNWSGIDF